MSKVFTFGPGNALAGSLTLPRQTARLGAVIWGMGFAEMQIAKRLAHSGIAALQIRIDDGNRFEDFDRRNFEYDRMGVTYARAALEHLSSCCGVSSFLLLGNCATANICFNTAKVDTRVKGLIMTNPHFREVERFMARLRWRWKMRGTRTAPRGKPSSNPAGPSPDASSIPRRLFRGLVNRRPRHSRDVVLDADFGAGLEVLVKRSVRVLIAYACGEASLDYLQRKHGRVLEKLREDGSLTLRVFTSDAHVFSNDEAAALELNQAVRLWVDGAFPATTPATTPAAASRPQAEIA